jgi:phosphotransferase system  glucose/maltose/N-acetylglucosamine-specific IIC component
MISLFLFLFLLIIPWFHNYLDKVYGFEKDTAYLFTAFLYLLIMQPLLFLGMKMINTLIHRHTYIHSPGYISNLERENKELKDKLKQQSHTIGIQKQRAHFNDTTSIIKELYTIITKAVYNTTSSITEIRHKMNKMILILKRSRFFDHIKISEMKADMEKQINTISIETIRIKEMTGAIHDNYTIKPSFPLWIGCKTLLNNMINLP